MATNTFNLVVPDSSKPISIVKVWLTLTDTTSAIFTIDHALALGSPESYTVTVNPGGNANLLYSQEVPSGAQPDRIQIERPSVAGDDPLNLTCLITFTLNSNANSCVSTITADDKWTVTVSGPEFTSVAQVS